MPKQRSISFTLLLSSLFLLNTNGHTEEVLSHFYTPAITNTNAPWFTGPLLAPAVHTIPQQDADIEPYLYFWSFTGSYNKNWDYQSSPNFYSVQLQALGWVGINSFIDFTIAPQAFYQFTQGERSTQFGDIPFGFDIQLLNEQVGTWWPAIKLGLQAIAPTGKFNNLNPSKLGTDSVGQGTWYPNASIALGRLFLLPNGHFLSPRLVFNYAVPNAVRVKNQNAYGGVVGTKGTVYPGNTFWADLGLEYNLTQHWALAFDLFFTHSNKVRFSGNPGEISPGMPAVMTSPSSEQLSIAPAMEYNLNANMGLISGVWMTVAGRNSSRFITGIIAFNIYI